MDDSFSFCGVDISQFDMLYVPELENTYVFSAGELKTNEETFEGHQGGYYYGTTHQPKQFTLRCVFTNQNITRGIISRVEGFFRIGRTGRLVFGKRPWAYYVATVTGIDTTRLTNYANGYVTITLKAYYPFARCDNLSLWSGNVFDEYVYDHTALLSESMTPETSFTNITETKTLLLYNPGSIRASVALRASGNAGEGILIRNATTAQESSLMAFSKGVTSDSGKYLLVDGMNGKTVLTDGTTSEAAFKYHSGGFIELEPAYPIYRGVAVDMTKDSNEIRLITEATTEDLVGRYVFMDKAWNRVESMTEDNRLTVRNAAQKTQVVSTWLVTMNEITVELGAGASLDSLEFLYKPTFQ